MHCRCSACLVTPSGVSTSDVRNRVHIRQCVGGAEGIWLAVSRGAGARCGCTRHPAAHRGAPQQHSWCIVVGAEFVWIRCIIVFGVDCSSAAGQAGLMRRRQMRCAADRCAADRCTTDSCTANSCTDRCFYATCMPCWHVAGR